MFRLVLLLARMGLMVTGWALTCDRMVAWVACRRVTATTTTVSTPSAARLGSIPARSNAAGRLRSGRRLTARTARTRPTTVRYAEVATPNTTALSRHLRRASLPQTRFSLQSRFGRFGLAIRPAFRATRSLGSTGAASRSWLVLPREGLTATWGDAPW